MTDAASGRITIRGPADPASGAAGGRSTNGAAPLPRDALDRMLRAVYLGRWDVQAALDRLAMEPQTPDVLAVIQRLRTILPLYEDATPVVATTKGDDQ